MNDLLTLQDIADMHHCSIRHARDVIVRLPGFPAEAPTSTPRNRLWLRREVRAFLNRKPEQNRGQNPARFTHTATQAA